MELRQPIYLILLSTTFLMCCFRWRNLKPADKLIPTLLGLTVLQELAAYGCYKLYQNNMPTYHIYSPVEFFILCLYFNRSTKTFGKRNLGFSIGLIGVAAGIINTAYLQPILTFNSYYLLFEGTVIIIMCLVSLCEILLEETQDFINRPSFWFILALMLYWSVTYTGWGVFNLLQGTSSKLHIVFTSILYIANLLFYATIAVISITYKKQISSGK